MANITISDLCPAGFDLLSDSESFMKELSSGEISIQGGIINTLAAVAISATTVSVAASVGFGIGILAYKAFN